MKKIKTIYWASTVLAILTGATSEPGIAKILGILVLIIPTVPTRAKEWVYIDFAINRRQTRDY